jgi:hypothetical protein
MIEILRWLGILIRAAVRRRCDLALENLALRQQLAVLKRKGVPRLRRNDRWFWVVLSRLWASWRRALHLVKADTVVGWQRKGFRIYWAKVSQRKRGGRPPASPSVNPAHGGREPVLGCSPNSWRIAQAGNRNLRAYGFPHDTQAPEAPFPDLEGFPEQPGAGFGLGRLVAGELIFDADFIIVAES